MPGKETIRGYIEKKKDWIERARDYQKKEKKIRLLKQKAKDKNPDEFNFHMIRSKVRLDGVHEDLASSDEETETQKLLSDICDLQYVTHKYSIELKKIEKLRSVLHFPQTTTPNKRIIFVDSDAEMEMVKEKLINEMSSKKVNDTTPEAQKQYLELEKRLERAEELKIVIDKLQLKKNLALSKKNELKPKLIQKGSKKKAAIYQWKLERKK